VPAAVAAAERDGEHGRDEPTPCGARAVPSSHPFSVGARWPPGVDALRGRRRVARARLRR
jgi:hypothetical protein